MNYTWNVIAWNDGQPVETDGHSLEECLRELNDAIDLEEVLECLRAGRPEERRDTLYDQSWLLETDSGEVLLNLEIEWSTVGA